jgi:hypothetical protein
MRLCSAQTSVNERRSKIENENDDYKDDWGGDGWTNTEQEQMGTGQNGASKLRVLWDDQLARTGWRIQPWEGKAGRLTYGG